MASTSRTNNGTQGSTRNSNNTLRKTTKIKYNFNLQHKLKSEKYTHFEALKTMEGQDFSIAYVQSYGFTNPILFESIDDLGLRVPSDEFTVNDVCLCVGPNRMLDVIDVTKQVNFNVTMDEWTNYFTAEKRDKVLNASLEFSNTKLADKIQIPAIVEELDWVNYAWPEDLKEGYPFVQKYCLMSVEGCYTDFHISVGGTSVWYHILNGIMVFWLIPATEENFIAYEKWALTEKKNRKFFGDIITDCRRVTFSAGDTVFIPSGWIFAVYTHMDSLMFGGKFLHSFSITKQIRTAYVEESIKVPKELRYPFFARMLWYVLERYVEHDSIQVEFNSINAPASCSRNPPEYTLEQIHITKPEFGGIIAMMQYLFFLPHEERDIPPSIKPLQLISNFSQWRVRHLDDKPEYAVSGISFLKRIVPDK